MGMMGASLAHTLKTGGVFSGKITGAVRSKKSADFIVSEGLADDVLILPDSENFNAVDWNAFDFIVFGLPVQSVKKILPSIPPCSAIITDMSSTRRGVEDAAKMRKDLKFIGSHPMCGSEDAGPIAYQKDLYKDRLCILTPPHEEDSENENLSIVRNFWISIGMLTTVLTPEQHDEMLAYLSHAPHFIAGALTLWAWHNGSVQLGTETSPMPVTGGGFKDMSRIAGSNPEMWADIFETNRDNILSSLEKFSEDIIGLNKKLKKSSREELTKWFIESRLARNILCGYPKDK